MEGSKVQKVYAAKTQDAQEAAYDDWAADYERDLCAMGYRSPIFAATVFARFVSPADGPVLDAGCGGGLQAEPLAALGFEDITGLDLSDGMLGVARAKGIYSALVKAPLGAGLPEFQDNQFTACISVGTITPGHAPASAFDDLIRVTRSGGKIVTTLRNDPDQDPSYMARIDALSAAGKWRHVFTSGQFPAMPYGEPEVTSVIHVFETL